MLFKSTFAVLYPECIVFECPKLNIEVLFNFFRDWEMEIKINRPPNFKVIILFFENVRLLI